jgi:nitrilase
MNTEKWQDKMNETFKVALVQSAPSFFDINGTLDKVALKAKQAQNLGATLIVFPEAFISGYPKGADFGVKCGLRQQKGREEFKHYWQSSIAIPSPELERLSTIAADVAAYLVIGVIERCENTLFCSVLFFAPDGQYLGKHRKLIPTAFERVLWGQGDGSTMPVFETPIGKLGAAICWENYMPLYRTFLYARGVQLYCAPTVDDREAWISSMRHIAMEGRCFVFSCCQFATQNDLAQTHKLDINSDTDPLIRGGSCVVNPLGEIIAGPVYNEETIVVADINLEEVIQGKFDLDVTGHYARPDIFRLAVNDSEMLNLQAWNL